MKKYGSLIIVLGAMIVSSVAFADIPIVHRDLDGKDGKQLQDAVGKIKPKTKGSDSDAKEVCPKGVAALEHCGVGTGCVLTCMTSSSPGESSSNHKPTTNRKTASAPATTDSSGQ
jgi:hypothetical protein